MNPTDFILGEIERLSRLEKAASGGPWRKYQIAETIQVASGPIPICRSGYAHEEKQHADMSLIAGTRNALPGLLSALLVMTKSLEHDVRCSGSFANDVLTEAAKALGWKDLK